MSALQHSSATSLKILQELEQLPEEVFDKGAKIELWQGLAAAYQTIAVMDQQAEDGKTPKDEFVKTAVAHATNL